MLKNTLLVAVAAASLTLAACGAGGCSQEDAIAKATEVGNAMQKMAQTNPEKMMEITKKLQDVSSKLAGSGDYSEACAAYDEMLAAMK